MGPALDDMIAGAVKDAGSEAAAVGAQALDAADFHLLLSQELYEGRAAWQLPVSSLFLQIAALEDAALYTLNFDPLLELAWLRVREMELMTPSSGDTGWQARRAEWPPSKRPSASAPAGVHHLNGWIDPDGKAGGGLVITGRDFVRKYGDPASPARKALTNLLDPKGAMLLLGIEAGSDALRRLLSCLPEENRPAIYAILTRASNGPATWFQEKLLAAHGIHSLWRDTPEETEVILRNIKFGPPAAGKPPQWIQQSLAWRSQQAPDDDIFSDAWQAFAHTALQALILQIRTLFPSDVRESLNSSVLLPVKIGSSAALQIVATSQRRRKGAEARSLASVFSLSIEADREQGLSGLVFARGCAMESRNSIAETERNFTPEMRDNWYRDLGYKEWRSLLSVPMLDSPSWVPVAVITLTSNMARPFWADLDASAGGDLGELMAAMRRTAKILVAEYRSSPERKIALKYPVVPSSDPALISREVSRELRGASLLVNYNGYVNARWQDVPAGGMTCFVSFTPEPAAAAAAGDLQSAPVQIDGGIDAPEVEFRLDIVSPTLRFRPSGAVVKAPAKARSAELVFECAKAPADRISHRMFIQIFQRSRLLQVLRLEWNRPKE